MKMKDNAKLRCLVLGGCGFIGSQLVDGLLDKGYKVVIFDKIKVDTKNINHNLKRTNLILGDFANKDDLRRAVRDIDYIFHFIGTTLPQSSTENPIYDIQSNVISTINLLDLSRSAGIKKIIFASSGGTIYGIPQQIPIPEDHPTNPICAYGISKLIIEKYLHVYYHLYNLDYIILRISNAYGERQDPNSGQGAVAVFLDKIMNNAPIYVWGDGKVLRDYIYVKDVVEAVIKVAEIDQIDHHILNIGSGVGTSLKELINILSQITGRDIQITYEDKRKIDVPINILDISLAERILSWKPNYSLADGIKKILDHKYLGNLRIYE
jgi:UDP-glucose 4-epimerase